MPGTRPGMTKGESRGATHRAVPPLCGVLPAPILEVRKHGGELGDIHIAAADVAQIVAVRLFLDVADAVFWNDGAVAIAETVDRAGADTAARVAAGHDDGVDALLVEIFGDAGVEEDRRPL